MDKERIGFIATRFAGTDGVSLEAKKWSDLLKEDGHEVFWYAGRLDHSPHNSFCIPEAHFNHPEIQWINQRIWGRTRRDSLTTRRIRDVSEYLKETIHDFVNELDLSMLIIQNALTIPMNLPLGMALSEFLMESDIPAIAHHHDFFWERSRFMVNAVNDYLEMAFPPRDKELRHVVINQNGQELLAWRKGLSSTLVPNVLDFDSPPGEPDEFAADFRERIGLKEDDILFLQPTRVVPRKGIEHAINLLSMLNDPRCKLVITHDSGDEGYEYEYMLRKLAARENVDVRFVGTQVSDIRQLDEDGQKIYTLWDIYPHADFVTYPSLYEGFGNAFLEAVYFKIPMLVNRYDIFMRDIEPKGFSVISMDGYMTPEVADQVQHLLENPEIRENIVEHNYEQARKFYSYSVLRRKLQTVIANIRGE